MSDKNHTDISSTEKLLKAIRNRGEEDPFQVADSRRPGFFKRTLQKCLPGRTGDVLAVEISRDALNLVRSSPESLTGRKIVYAVAEPLPPGMNFDHTDFSAFIKERIQRSGAIAGKTEVWACLPASKGNIWGLKVPRVRKNLGNAVYWTAKKEKTFDDAETLLDYRIAGEAKENGTQKLLAEVSTVPRRELDRYKKLFSDIGFPLKGATLPAFALKNLFYTGIANPGQGTYAVLCIGEKTSSIDIHSKNRVLFSRVIRTGKDSVVDSLAAKYNPHYGNGDADGEIVLPGAHEAGSESPKQPAPLSRQQAARILENFDDAAAASDGRLSPERIFAMIEPALERLARQLERTIDYSGNMLQNPPPEKLYICGCVSFLPGIAAFFGEHLDITAEVLDIFDPELPHVSADVVFSDLESRFSLASAAGLALPSEKIPDFLHTAFDRDRENHAMRSTNAVAAGCALLFLLTAGYWWYALHEQEQARAAVSARETQLAEISPHLDAAMLTKMAGETRQTQQTLVDYTRRLHVTAVINEINRLTPENIRMLNMTLEMDRPEAEARPASTGQLVLEGFIHRGSAGFDTDLAGYIRQLRRSPLIRDVVIRRTTMDASVAADEVYRFIVRIDLERV